MSLKTQISIFIATLALTCFSLFILLNSSAIWPFFQRDIPKFKNRTGSFLKQSDTNSSAIWPFFQWDMPKSKNRNASFLKLPDTDCNRNPPFLVILVTSRLGEIKARSVIRETWGKERTVAGKRIVTYFLLGISSRPDDQLVVSMESLKYKDIIQKDFMDTYYNLTLKTLMGLEWVHKFCPQSKFVMKTDSDMFVNTYFLTELLIKKNRTTKFFTGSFFINASPIRDRNSKWYVSKEEYPGNNYPPFCSGTGYVFSTDVANDMYIVSKKVPFFKLEDVFIGLCLAELQIKLEKLHSEEIFFPGQVQFSPCRYKKIVTSHYITPNKIQMYWLAVERSKNEKCPGETN